MGGGKGLKEERGAVSEVLSACLEGLDGGGLGGGMGLKEEGWMRFGWRRGLRFSRRRVMVELFLSFTTQSPIVFSLASAQAAFCRVFLCLLMHCG